jgi:TetR/AcrR family transcriptional regulator, cholesterol catabolism regulator
MARSTTTRSRNPGGKRREREIFDAATDIFHRRGYADTSVEDIADAVGILKGSLYHYINSKEDLLFAILTEVHEDVDAMLQAAMQLEEADPLDRLLDYVHDQVSYNARNVKKIAVYYHDQNQLSPERLQEITRRRRAHERYVADLIKQAQEGGSVAKDLDASLLAAEVFASMIWLYTWYRPGGGSVSADSLAGFTVDFLRRAMTGSAAKAKSSPRRRAAKP